MATPTAASGIRQQWAGGRCDVAATVTLLTEFAEWVPLNRPMGTAGTWKRLYKSHRLEWMAAAGALDGIAEGIANANVRFSPDVG